MPAPLVTLITDFGTTDPFVGVMKGVILGIAPRTRIVDITHSIAPFQITEGSFVIAESYSYFPKGTIHVVVVDPGVGSDRRPIVVESGGHKFVGPDNGVFSAIYALGSHSIRQITNTKWRLENPSRTFHGRDIFAPAAARLAKGAKASSAGKLVYDPVTLKNNEPRKNGSKRWRGAVIRVDRFGNLMTNFRSSEFSMLRNSRFTFACSGATVKRISESYSEAQRGELLLIAGSSGYLEIAANQDSAAAKLGCGPGAELELLIS